MIKDNNAGYKEIPHTADWELLVWGTDMPDLMKQAAEGMYALSGTRLADRDSENREFKVPLLDRESALVDFLSELLFFSEQEGIGFDYFEITQDEESYTIKARCAPIEEKIKEIKAVTYHDLSIRETDSGLEVNIVFDV